MLEGCHHISREVTEVQGKRRALGTQEPYHQTLIGRAAFIYTFH